MHRMKRLGAVREVDGPGTAGGLIAGAGHVDESRRAVVDAGGQDRGPFR
jgi:hypothetical protein